MRILRQVGEVRAPRERVFGFLEDAKMADQLLPSFLELEVLRAAWLPGPGSRTHLNLTHRHVPFSIELETIEYQRGAFLLDRQVAGPFTQLEHALRVEDTDHGCRVTEVLAYALPFRILGKLFDRLSLRHDLGQLLRVRQRRLRDLLEPTDPGESGPES